MTTRQFIRRIRVKFGLTIEAFAEMVNTSPRTVYRWESGTNKPNADVMILILELCKKRGIQLDELVFFDTCVILNTLNLYIINYSK